MSTTSYPHLVIDDGGNARIGRTRYKVIHLAAEHYHQGWSAEELLRQHGDLRPKEVYAALAYFYDHFDEFVAQMIREANDVDARRLPTPLSRDELLSRRNEVK